jgi:hypothetical protein
MAEGCSHLRTILRLVYALVQARRVAGELFAQSRTLRIRQSIGLDFSNVVSTSPLRPFQSYLGVTFIRFRGPKALNVTVYSGQGADIVMQSSGFGLISLSA